MSPTCCPSLHLGSQVTGVVCLSTDVFSEWREGCASVISWWSELIRTASYSEQEGRLPGEDCLERAEWCRSPVKPGSQQGQLTRQRGGGCGGMELHLLWAGSFCLFGVRRITVPDFTGFSPYICHNSVLFLCRHSERRSCRSKLFLWSLSIRLRVRCFNFYLSLIACSQHFFVIFLCLRKHFIVHVITWRCDFCYPWWTTRMPWWFGHGKDAVGSYRILQYGCAAVKVLAGIQDLPSSVLNQFHSLDPDYLKCPQTQVSLRAD